MLTGKTFEEFDLAYTDVFRRQNALIAIPFDYLLRIDAVGNYDADWNSCEKKLNFCVNLQGKAFNDDAETLYNLLVQYVGTYGTGNNTLSCHTRSKNGRKYYPEIKGHFKTETYEETKLQRPMLFLEVHIITETGSSH